MAANRKKRERTPPITDKQFNAISTLLRKTPGASSNAMARLVLVDGVKQVEARVQGGNGVTCAAVSNAVRRYRKVDQMLREAYQSPGEAISEAQYLCLVKLLRGTLASQANIIARRVLVEGMTTSQAKGDMQTPPCRSTISAAINCYRKAHKVALDAYGPEPDPE